MGNEIDSARCWQVFCEQQGRGVQRENIDAQPDRAHLERIEMLWIEQLRAADEPLIVRAAAFRSIIALRDCTARQLATFFGVEPAVVVLGLSLLERPTDVETKALVVPDRFCARAA